ncbi:hypothetical protein [Pontitalea aquivivens]|uniref:hypothetical protein n=1 Tax=Pontitalea aquivivens TaxID=3388663 RepID=UPI0039709F81
MANRIHISRTKDVAQQQIAADHYQASFHTLGVDLSRIALSDAGFIDRTGQSLR